MNERFIFWIKENDRFLVSLAIFAALLISVSLTGWGVLGNDVKVLMGGSNIEELHEICNDFCLSEDKKAFCEVERKIVYPAPTFMTFLVPTPDDGIGYEKITRKRASVKSTCYRVANGKAMVLNSEGELKEFSLSFPGIRMNKCRDLCEG